MHNEVARCNVHFSAHCVFYHVFFAWRHWKVVLRSFNALPSAFIPVPNEQNAVRKCFDSQKMSAEISNQGQRCSRCPKSSLHRHRPQIVSTHPNCKKKQTRKELSICNHEEGQAWETRRQRQLRAAQNGDHEGRQAWKTRRQPRAAQNGDHEGRQMKRDKAAAAAKSSPEWRS